jgi:hypothetical protein
MTLRCAILLLSITAATTAAEPLYVETDGLVVIEIESVPPTPGWAAQKKEAGFTGRGYYTWTGGNSYGGPGGQKPLVYKILITKAGTYQFRTRNFHAHARRDLGNDAWVRMDAGAWVKCFSSQDKKWTWHNRFEPSHGKFAAPEYELSTGWHLLQIAGRSHGFSIDRIHLFLKGSKGSEDHTRSETRGLPRTLKLKATPAAAKAWDDGQLGKAMILLADAKGDAEAQQGVDQLKRYAVEQQQRLDNLKSQDSVAAVVLLRRLAKAYAGSDVGRQFSVKVKEWAAEPAYKKELAAGKILRVMQQNAARLPKSGSIKDRKFVQRYRQPLSVLAQGLKKLAKSYETTKAYGAGQAIAARYGL